MADRITPRLLKGFRDFLPDDERERQRIRRILAETFAAFGFEPIDTPILEYTDILLGKGGGETDKQVYRFVDQGGRDIAMRYDLTVPFARFMSLHFHDLALPFKRFHIGKVFRGENTQRGRYREFVQCDFDIVGSDSASADFEIVLLMDRSFRAIGAGGVRIHVSHRGVFNALLDRLGVADRGPEILRIVDKLRKIGSDAVRDQLSPIMGTAAGETILEYVNGGETNQATLAAMRRAAPDAIRHVNRIEEVLRAAETVGVADRIVLDPSITRGLDYYTGMVFETFLTDLPAIGSVCSGGRYDNLASLYTKERLPGVGASIGLDRLMAGLQELSVEGGTNSAADAMIVCTDEGSLGEYHAIADRLRKEGLRVDVYPEPKKPGGQFAWAEKNGIPAALLTDGTGDRVTVRELRTRSNTEGVPIAEAARIVRSIGAADHRR